MPSGNGNYEGSLIGLAKYYGSFYEDREKELGVEAWSFIIDAESYEMLHVQGRLDNELFERLGDWRGRSCYKWLECRNEPCESCHARCASKDNYYVSTKIDPIRDKRYFIENIMIEHNGRPAILEKVIDISDVGFWDKVMNEYIGTKNLSNRIISILMEETHITENFERACKEICDYFDADRALITEYCMGKLNTAWSKIPQPFTQVCTELSEESIADLTRATANLNYIWVPDVPNADKLDKNLREYWSSRGIESILLIPMHFNGSFIGTVSLHNIRRHLNAIDTLKLLGMAVAKCIHAYMTETRAERQLFADPLTGALNLTGLKRKTYELFREFPENQYYFCVMDIRYFGGLNRRYGFDLGDRILIKVANNLDRFLDKDEVFCRISADVFCFVAKFPGEEAVHSRFTKFAESLQTFEELQEADYTIELQCGAFIMDSDTSIAQAIDKANMARLFLKDETGSSIAFFSNELLEKSKRETELMQDFRAALSHGELSVYFQPQCNYSSQKIVGAEALVRWKSAKHGNVSPAEFIPLLEKHGRIHELDQFVWEEVCRYQRRWIDMGIKCPVSVNVSRNDVLGNNICAEMCELLDRYQIPKELIPLEITETAYIKNSEELIEAVETLKRAGFKMEMDDFGSGYSSLNALKDVSVDLLKLDMKFLDMGSQPGKGGSILSCVVRMTRWLGLEVLAEGVETREQAEYLKNIGCDLMQGYYFARPMPADEFEKMLLSSNISNRNEQKEEVMHPDQFMEVLVANPVLFNSIGPAAIAEHSDGNTETLMVNDGFLEALDMTRDEFLPYMNHLDVCMEKVVTNPEDMKLHVDTVDGMRTRECTIRHKDGSNHRVRIYSRSLLRVENRMILLICINDISEIPKQGVQ